MHLLRSIQRLVPMRPTRSIWCAALAAAAACSSGLEAPPAGLPVTFGNAPISGFTNPSIIGAGDSVTVLLGALPCSTKGTEIAGLRAGELIVTISRPLVPPPCMSPPALRLVVHDVPPATRSARAVLRIIQGDHATYSLLVRNTVTLP
jgi:hypothetical protein